MMHDIYPYPLKDAILDAILTAAYLYVVLFIVLHKSGK